MINKLYIITIYLLLIGLGTAVFHPIVHASAHTDGAASNTIQQVNDEIVSADSCYVCVFSKVLTTDDGNITELYAVRYLASSVIFPSFQYNYCFSQVIHLRGPPATL